MSTATHIFKKNSMTHAIAYSPYGYCPPAPMQMAATGFNGERSDPVTYNYALGAGYRFFNPALMRFTSPDAVSPFGSGGLNPYCYCLCDPINLSDPDGRTPAQPWNIIRLRTMFPSLHKRKTSFQINLEEFDANISNYKSTLGRRHEFGSARSLVASPAVDEIPPGWDRIGIHGSSTTNKKSLLKSLDPKLIKPRGGGIRSLGVDFMLQWIRRGQCSVPATEDNRITYIPQIWPASHLGNISTFRMPPCNLMKKCKLLFGNRHMTYLSSGRRGLDR